MSEYKVTFTLDCATFEQAQQVVQERITAEEDYGFGYSVRDIDVEDRNPPEMIVDGEDLRCPHCSATDGVYLIDVAWRENECEVQVEDADEGTLTLMVTEGDGEYNTDHYECVGCRGLVSVPADIDTSW